MSDYNSSLPVRTETNGDVVAQLVDGTVLTQKLAIDASGLIGSKAFDRSGNGIDSQTLSATQWLQVVIPSTGPSAPGAASAYASLAAGIYNATPPTLADTEQSALQLDANGRLLVDALFGEDHDYGVVGANTLRTAAQIGNATGAADFNFGAVGAQTLRAAAQIGNATGAADFNAGATGAQTLRTVANQGAPNTNANGWFVRVTDGTNNQVVTAAGEARVQASNFPNTVDTNYGAVGASTLRTASQVGNATGAADFNNGATGAQTLRVAANLAVAGADVSTSNPVPVIVTDATPGTPINNYNTIPALAANATSNHDYTVTALKTFYLNQIEASGSGKAKIEVQVETAVSSGVFNTRWVQFNSTANTNMSIHIENPIAVAAGVRVRIIRTNKDNQAQDLYSTISGYELP